MVEITLLYTEFDLCVPSTLLVEGREWVTKGYVSSFDDFCKCGATVAGSLFFCIKAAIGKRANCKLEDPGTG